MYNRGLDIGFALRFECVDTGARKSMMIIMAVANLKLKWMQTRTKRTRTV